MQASDLPIEHQLHTNLILITNQVQVKYGFNCRQLLAECFDSAWLHQSGVEVPNHDADVVVGGIPFITKFHRLVGGERPFHLKGF